MSQRGRFMLRNWLTLSMAVGAVLAGTVGYMLGERRLSDERV